MVIPHAFSRNAQPGLKEQNVNIADTPYYLVVSNMEYLTRDLISYFMLLSSIKDREEKPL
jgi:hypothetical protein